MDSDRVWDVALAFTMLGVGAALSTLAARTERWRQSRSTKKQLAERKSKVVLAAAANGDTAMLIVRAHAQLTTQLANLASMMFALTLIVLGTLNEDDEVRTVAVMVVVVGQVTLGFCTVTLFRLARRAREEYDAAIAPVLKAAGIED